MTKQEALTKIRDEMKKCADNDDYEMAHSIGDDLLLELIVTLITPKTKNIVCEIIDYWNDIGRW